jgi:hypothetical protein
MIMDMITLMMPKKPKDFVKDIIEFLRTGVYDDIPIEIDPDLPENISQLLIDAFKELNTDGIFSSVSREIDEVDEKDLRKVGLFGKNLELKLRIYAELRSWLKENHKEKKSRWDKFKEKFKKFIGLSNTILGSLAKILPGAALGIDALGEFKDLYRETRKAIS